MFFLSKKNQKMTYWQVKHPSWVLLLPDYLGDWVRALKDRKSLKSNQRKWLFESGRFFKIVGRGFSRLYKAGGLGLRLLESQEVLLMPKEGTKTPVSGGLTRTKQKCRLPTFNLRIVHYEGRHSTTVLFALFTQQPRVWFSAFLRFFLKNYLLILLRLIDGTSQSVDKLEYVDRTI